MNSTESVNVLNSVAHFNQINLDTLVEQAKAQAPASIAKCTFGLTVTSLITILLLIGAVTCFIVEWKAWQEVSTFGILLSGLAILGIVVSCCIYSNLLQIKNNVDGWALERASYQLHQMNKTQNSNRHEYIGYNGVY